MEYWGSYASVEPPQPGVFTPDGLIEHADGRCGAWAYFFLDVLRAQGHELVR